jgi:hypothetical protein
LPPGLRGALRLLGDPALARWAATGRRRGLLKHLRGRHAKAVDAIREALGVGPRHAGTRVVVHVHLMVLVYTIGTHGCPDDPFAGLEDL